MYPDLSYLFHDLFGSSTDNWLAVFKTFGVFLALAFLSSGYVLYLELRRKEDEGLLQPRKITSIINKASVIREAVISGLIGFFLCFKAPYIYQNFADFKIDPASLVFSGKGNILIGLLGGIAFAAYNYFAGMKNKDFGVRKEYNLYPSHRVYDITGVAAISGIAGARLFSIFENMDAFIKDPIGQLFSGSGLTIYGGLIVAFVVVFIYVKKIGIRPIHVMDAVAPALVIGYMVGRMGCQFSGDGDWGIVNDAPKPSWFIFPDWAWSFDYGRNVLNRGVPMEDCVGAYCNHLVPGVFPTPVYEIIASAIIFGILWFLRKRLKVAGMLFFVYAFLNGLERFFIEDIRVNDTYDFMGFDWSLSKFIALAYMIVGLAGFSFLWQKRKEFQSAS